MTKCKLCKERLFEMENCFGDTKDMGKICCNCFEGLSKDERKGIVPVTRGMVTPEWKSYVHKFGLET